MSNENASFTVYIERCNGYDLAWIEKYVSKKFDPYTYQKVKEENGTATLLQACLFVDNPTTELAIYDKALKFISDYEKPNGSKGIMLTTNSKDKFISILSGYRPLFFMIKQKDSLYSAVGGAKFFEVVAERKDYIHELYPLN